MERLSSCMLISFRPDAHEAGEDPVALRRTVKCTEKSVGMTEAYQARGLGLNPEKKLLIPYERDYHGERELEYQDERWKVIRTAGGEWNGVLLTIQRDDGNSGSDDGTPEASGDGSDDGTPEAAGDGSEGGTPEAAEDGSEGGTEAGGETG